MKTGRRWLRVIARLVPDSARDEWIREWSAELEHALLGGRRRLRVCVSATEDAFRLLPSRLASLSYAQDLRFIVRSLRTHRGFTLTAVMTIALGVGANTAIFSVVHAYMLEPLPIVSPDRVFGLLKSMGEQLSLTSAPNYLDIRESSESFEHLAAVHLWSSNFSGGDVPQRVSRARVTTEFFDVIGVRPAMGRLFEETESIPGNDAVVVLSNAMWVASFGSDLSIVGRTVRVDGVPSTVVGVLPREFRAPPFTTDIYVPLAFLPDALEARGRNNLHVMGRLATGVSQDRAQQELDRIGARLAADHPRSNTGWGIRAIPIKALGLGTAPDALWKLLAAVGLVLLISCVNVANLVIARGMTRDRELSVRVSLGASRARLLGLLLLETVLIGVAGGAVGMLLAIIALDPIQALVPASLASVATVELNGSVLIFGFAASVLSGIGAGILPALRLSADARKASAHGLVASRLRTRGGTDRIRAALSAVQFALATLLLIAAGLVARSLARIYTIDVGVRTDGVTVFNLTFPESEYPTPDHVIRAVDGVLANLNDMPEVSEAAATSHLPLTGSRLTSSVLFEGGPEFTSTDGPSSNLRVVSANYFDLLGIPLVKGRAFSTIDDERGEPVAVVNEALARAFWPDGQAIDRWIAYAPDSTGTNLHRRVIGVIADVRHGGPMSEAGPEVYEVHRQTTEIWRWFGRSMAFAAHTRDGRVLPIDRVRDAVRAIDPSLPVTAHSSLDAVLGRSVASPRFNGVLLGSFAGLALLLAAIGLYGVLAFSVRQRRREVGVRIALGALRGTVLRAVLLDALRLVAIGSVVGVGVAVALGKTLETFVWGLPPTDPLTYVTVIVVLACVALAAAALPAWRAASVDPVISLREE